MTNINRELLDTLNAFSLTSNVVEICLRWSTDYTEQNKVIVTAESHHKSSLGGTVEEGCGAANFP
jgi:hypothetical protein